MLSAYSRIPGVYTQDDQIVTFTEGLHDAVSAGVTCDRQLSPYKYETPHYLMELVHSHGTVERARRPNFWKDKTIVKRTLLVEPGTGLDATVTGDEAALAIEGGHTHSPPSTPSYTMYLLSEETPAHAVPSNNTDSTASAALPIFLNRNPRLHADAQPYRPGWVDRGVKYATVLKNPQHGNKALTSGNANRSCFVCASRSHYVPDCPFVNETVRLEARRNLMEATPAERALLPRWTYQFAGIPLSKQDPQPLRTSLAEADNTDKTKEKGNGA